MNADRELRRPRKAMPTGYEVYKAAKADNHRASRRRRRASTIALAICILAFLAIAKGWLWFTETFFQP